MDVHELRLPEANINIAVDDIIDAIGSVVDRDGQVVFRSVSRGLLLPNSVPREDNVPAIRIWHSAAKVADESVQFFSGQTCYDLSIFVVCYSFTGGDLQQQRERLVKAVLQSLEQPEAGSKVGLVPHSSYWFDPQSIVIDHTSSLQRFADHLTVLPPWYVTRIDLQIQVDRV